MSYALLPGSDVLGGMELEHFAPIARAMGHRSAETQRQLADTLMARGVRFWNLGGPHGLMVDRVTLQLALPDFKREQAASSLTEGGA
jgi:hypothetical protein